MSKLRKVKVYAHRGASGACPENTMAAFRKAVELGVDGVETDVQLTRDGIPVLIHDEVLARTTGAAGMVADKTYAELQQLDAGAWFSPEFQGTRIPRLEELLEMATMSGIDLNIEIKSGVVLYPDIEKIVVQLIRQYAWCERTIISSFNHFSLVDCKKQAPEIRTGILYTAGLVDPWIYAQHVQADALHPLFYGVRPELVQGAHHAGIAVNPWTVDNPAHIAAMLKSGVDGIITNHPERVLEVLG